jgi:hypothetical protein
VVPTTSNPSRRSKSKSADIPQGSPIKSIRLIFTLDAAPGQLERLAAEKGFAVEEKGGGVSVVLTAATAEEALAKLRLVAGLLAPKP